MKYSIIIPAYNAAQTIERCILSVTCQDYEDYEIIIVDDGSTDQTTEIIQRLSRANPRIRLEMHPENKGPLQARKSGIKIATGKYIQMLDADDEVAQNYFSVLNRVTEKEPEMDIISFNPTVEYTVDDVSSEEKRGIEKQTRSYCKKLYGEEIRDACYLEHRYQYTIWNKLFRTNVCKNAISDVCDKFIAMSEDFYLYFIFSSNAKSYMGIPDKLYIYYFGEGISTRKQLSLAQYRMLNSGSSVTKALTEYCHNNKVYEKYKGIIAENASQILQCALWKIGNQRDTHFCERLALLEEAWTDEQLVLSAGALYWHNPQKAVPFLQRILKQGARSKNIKTIGMFYHRIYNGGLEKVITDLASHFAETGYRVILFTDCPENESDYPMNEKVIRVVLSDKVFCTFDGYEQRMELFSQELKKHHVDIMLYSAWASTAFFWDLCIFKICGIPTVVQAHGFFACVDNEMMERNACTHQYVDAVVSLSSADAAYWSTVCKRSYLTNNKVSIDTKIVRNETLPEGVIIWVGRISPEKNPAAALRVFKLVLNEVPNARLVMVGDGDPGCAKYTKALAGELKIEKHVDFAGFHLDVSSFYNNATVYLHTSNFESFGLSIAESLAFGVPAVVFELPNVDYVRESEAITKVKWNDCESAAKEVIRLLKDKLLWEKKSAEAKNQSRAMTCQDSYAVWKDVFADIESGTERSFPINGKVMSTIIETMLLMQKQAKQQNENNIESVKNDIYHSARYRLGNAILMLPQLFANFFKLIRHYNLIDTLYILKEQLLGRREAKI